MGEYLGWMIWFLRALFLVCVCRGMVGWGIGVPTLGVHVAVKLFDVGVEIRDGSRL